MTVAVGRVEEAMAVATAAAVREVMVKGVVKVAEATVQAMAEEGRVSKAGEAARAAEAMVEAVAEGGRVEVAMAVAVVAMVREVTAKGAVKVAEVTVEVVAGVWGAAVVAGSTTLEAVVAGVGVVAPGG